MVVVERDYSIMAGGHRYLYYADLLVDPSTGLVLRPLDSLASETNVRTLINTLTALSFQLTSCWLLVYSQDGSHRCTHTHTLYIWVGIVLNSHDICQAYIAQINIQ